MRSVKLFALARVAIYLLAAPLALGQAGTHLAEDDRGTLATEGQLPGDHLIEGGTK